MPEQLINGFYHGILMPLIDDFEVFLSSNRFYFSFPILLLLSILIAFIRCLQVINKNIMSLWYIESFGMGISTTTVFFNHTVRATFISRAILF